MAIFPATAQDLGEVVDLTLRTMAAVRRTCLDLYNLSATGPLHLSELNGAVVMLKQRRADLTGLEARVQPSDYQALRNWATANLRLPGGTAYAGDYVADYATGRDAFDAFMAWLQAQFPRSQNILWQASEEFNILVPAPWTSASPEATALRTQLQLVLNAIAS
jgi:hypothetical protein